MTMSRVFVAFMMVFRGSRNFKTLGFFGIFCNSSCEFFLHDVLDPNGTSLKSYYSMPAYLTIKSYFIFVISLQRDCINSVVIKLQETLRIWFNKNKNL